ncbi:MAG: FAD binding domain-containing protein [Candidatus Hadarchaeaceae archaeon]
MPGLRPIRKENVFEMELPTEITLQSMLLKAGFREDEIEHLRVFVNEKLAPLNKALKNGDNIWIGIVIGGEYIKTYNRAILCDFEYFEPVNISEAVSLLQKYGDDAKIIAGGTDLLVDIKEEKIKPKFLVSVMKIPDLRCIVEDGMELSIGAATTLAEIEESQIIKERYGLICEAVKELGTVQVRNMATIGGNICNAIPSADMPPALVALDARLKIVGVNGERTLQLEEFFVGVRKTRLKNELLKEIVVKRPPERSGTAFIKLARTSEDLAIFNTAVRVKLNKDNICEEARIVVGGGIGPTVLRSKEAEKFIEGRRLDEETINKAAEVSAQGLQCRADSIRAPPEYKIEVGKVLVRRALMRALKRASGEEQ